MGYIHATSMTTTPLPTVAGFCPHLPHLIHHTQDWTTPIENSLPTSVLITLPHLHARIFFIIISFLLQHTHCSSHGLDASNLLKHDALFFDTTFRSLHDGADRYPGGGFGCTISRVVMSNVLRICWLGSGVLEFVGRTDDRARMPGAGGYLATGVGTGKSRHVVRISGECIKPGICTGPDGV